MKNKICLVAAAAAAIGCCPIAQAEEVNQYFATPAAPMVTTSSPVLIESKVLTDTSCPPGTTTTVEKTITAPVLVQKTGTPPVLIEDRIVKRKHWFAIGIWPIFDFEIK